MLFYIGYYAEGNDCKERKIFLSAVNKMRYIIESIESGGINQQIISCAVSNGNKSLKGKFQQISPNVFLKSFFSFGMKNKLTKLLDMFFIKLQFFFYMMKNCKREDTLLVYHSPAFCKIVPLIRKIKKCKLILEVEEIYADVSNDTKARKDELYICSMADAFVFPTKMLNDAVNFNNKPYTVIHGTYKVEEEKEKIFCDDKIHIVYAGTFDPRKGGTIAVKTAEFLNEKYHIHIIGFGTENEKQNLLNEIENVKSKSQCSVTYDGCLSGEEYLRFIQSCDIGLSPQNPDASFNSTSFPSKILSYMSNGLRVVSIRIPAIETSAVGGYMYYYDNQTPEEIAKAIININIDNNFDGRNIISNLDISFKKEIAMLLGS